MKTQQQELGKRGEHLACQFLRSQGYKIIFRNFSCRFGEIDIIARDANTIVFIEVKTKSSSEFGLPQEAIRKDKIGRLIRSAQFYIKNYSNPEREYRFDVISIIFGENTTVQLIKDAF